MRLRPYRRHDDDARLLELSQLQADQGAPWGLSRFDQGLFERKRLADELQREQGVNGNAVVVAIADTPDELAMLTTAPNSTSDPVSGPNDGGGAVSAASGMSRIIGFVYLAIRPDTSSGRPEGHISHVCVDRRFRHRGVGRSLLTEAKHWARQNGLFKLSFDVMAQDESAIAFGEALDFRIASVRMEIPCASVDA
ncbi:GNAT family N-acetyltransferase [Bifidobacterium xylocopae]|uniref:N-acetyltransferase domain-containing protein n=1 Tax=Bifidobacterium xylocopae TaxID=2493119 RepID=A0A366KC57_9BIFI|nr:GNAT family N-acetyltransferase [Bifidobacterium xylocopae]RBP99326.1 hypothetical protein CRD59_04725 [Bifidobacterium xylocopae]